MKQIKILYHWMAAILLILVHGKDQAKEIIRDKQTGLYKDQINLEQKRFKSKTELKDLKAQMIQAIEQSEENEAIREKHFGPNPGRTAFVKKRNADKMEKYFGKD